MRGNRMGEFDTLELFRLWARGVPQHEICKTMNIRPGSLWHIRRRLALPKRECDKVNDFSKVAPPTPAEIAERAAAIRAAWPEGEAEKRLAGTRGRPVEIRQYAFDHQNYAFSGMDS